MAMLLKGAPAAAALTEELGRRTRALVDRGVIPTLAIVRTGAREDDLSYERAAVRRCEKIGIAVRQMLLPEDGTGLPETIREINADGGVHGCLLFRPLADRALEAEMQNLLDPRKDVDAMTPASLASVFSGQGPGYPPCTARACLALLDYYGIPIAGRRAAVIGRSLVIGRPVSMLLQRRDATVTMCHSRTADLPAVCREADILIAAAGQMGLVDGSFLRPGQTVLDVGIHAGPDGQLRGDVVFSEAEPVAEAITPVPGGVGAMTTAILASHVVDAAEKTL